MSKQTFLEKLKAKQQAKEFSILERMKEISEQQNSIGKLINGFAEEHKIAHNPYSSLPLFDGAAPDKMEDCAALMVAAFGYGTAIEIADKESEKASYKALMEDAHAWELLSEFLGQMQEKANAQSRTVQIQSAGQEDPLAPEPAEEFNIPESAGTGESFSLNIVLNAKQNAAKEMAFAGKSFCLIGPAGSGKTTAQRAVAAALLESGKLDTTSFKTQGSTETVSAPSIAFVAFTRRAASNLRKAVHKDPVLSDAFMHNIMTVHALLEYAPEYYWDSVEGKQKFRFAPNRTAKNPLTITHLVIEEASMIGAYDLWIKLYDALPERIQIIFIGDINQLPPVFGPSILNYALTQLPIVELTEVYRNQGMVLENAHHILKGEPIKETALCQIVRGNKATQTPQETMGNRILPNLFKTLYKTKDENGLGQYDPDYDIILSPFNKQAMGTIHMNNWIAQFLGEEREAIVHEVLAGFNKLYLAVGDRVMVNKMDGIITEINRNMQYSGKEPQMPGKDLSRFGIRLFDRAGGIDLDSMEDDPSIDYSTFSLEELEKQDAERKQQASHAVTVSFGEGYTETYSATGEFAPEVFALGYCLTTHKAQGSEWRKVYILMHKDHSTMLFREWFYTAYTRARIGVTVIAKDFLIEKAIKTPRIIGNTLADKLRYFNSGINNAFDVKAYK